MEIIRELLLFIFLIVVGLIVGRFVPSYFSKKGQNLATKEDIREITGEIETVKKMFKDQYDFSKIERESYEEMVKIIYKFLAKIKKYEFEQKVPVTKEIILENATLKQNFFEFIDGANEVLGKSYIFLKEENYKNLKDSLNIDNIKELGY